MSTEGDHGVGRKQRGRETEEQAEVACHPLAGISLDGPVPEDQRERGHQQRRKLQGEHGRPEQQEETCGEDPGHQRASGIIIYAVLGERECEPRDEFLSERAAGQFFGRKVEEVVWINQHQVQETARDKQQKESAERHSLGGYLSVCRSGIVRCHHLLRDLGMAPVRRGFRSAVRILPERSRPCQARENGLPIRTSRG